MKELIKSIPTWLLVGLLASASLLFIVSFFTKEPVYIYDKAFGYKNDKSTENLNKELLQRIEAIENRLKFLEGKDPKTAVEQPTKQPAKLFYQRKKVDSNWSIDELSLNIDLGFFRNEYPFDNPSAQADIELPDSKRTLVTLARGWERSFYSEGSEYLIRALEVTMSKDENSVEFEITQVEQ